MSYDHAFSQIGRTYISVNHTDHKEPIFDRVDITKSPREVKENVLHHVMTSLLAHSVAKKNGSFPNSSIRIQWDAAAPLASPVDAIAQAVVDGIMTASNRTKKSLVISVWVPENDKVEASTGPSRDKEIYTALKTAFDKVHSPKH